MQHVTDLPSLPPRPEDAHKGTFGTVLVVAGSRLMPGAPAMVAHSAFRAGAGLVKIAAPDDTIQAAITIEPSATGVSLDAVRDMTGVVFAVGPGVQLEGGMTLQDVLPSGDDACVLDADGLNALARVLHDDPHRPAYLPRRLVMTPHPGEFKRLAEALHITHSPVDPNQRVHAAQALAQQMNCVVVLKGHATVITDGERYAINDTGTPALATAGSGDVLTGLIAALLAQGMDTFEAAHLGVHLGGKAAEAWSTKHGLSGMLARELANELPGVMHAFREQAR